MSLVHTEDADFTLLCCDVLDGLRSLPDGSVHCVVTSPPYWGLRDYGTGTWDGGDPDCDHIGGTLGRQDAGRDFTGGGGNREGSGNPGKQQFRDECGKCGARRVDQQLGLEATPDLYVARIVEVFREVRRVLRADGTCWLNLGDSYASDPGKGGSGTPNGRNGRGENYGRERMAQVRDGKAVHGDVLRPYSVEGLRPKNLVGIPWRVAFALQADGWYLRSDIVWSKPNPMPESVTDRPTKAHEYVFLLSKSSRYFYDAEAIGEPAAWERWGDQTVGAGSNPNGWIKPKGKNELTGDRRKVGFNDRWDASEENGSAPRRRNARSVWEIATQPYPEAHFATFPEALVERCVKAGTSERGCCPECGAAWERKVEREVTKEGEAYDSRMERWGDDFTPPHQGGRSFQVPIRYNLSTSQATTIGWRPGCDCISLDSPVPCTVLDPFLGSGTTAFVARRLGRKSIGIELNPDYCQLAAKRLQQQSLLV